jgi:hypothetical protein
MSRFYANIKGTRGEATRQGSGRSGITSHTRGWNLGVRVQGYPAIEDAAKQDEFCISITGGSAGARLSAPLACVSENSNGSIRVTVEVLHDIHVYYINRDGSRTTKPKE